MEESKMFFKQSIIEMVEKIESKKCILMIYYFVKEFLVEHEKEGGAV